MRLADSNVSNQIVARLAFAIVLLASGPLLRAQGTGDFFAGQYSDGDLTLNLRSEAGGYAGTIARGSETFKASAALKGDGLDGTFQAAGKDFAFTVARSGDGLTFKTDGKDYHLKKVGAANPLGAPDAAAVSPAKADVVRFEPCALNDDPNYIGGEISRFVIPAGWKLDSSVKWDMRNMTDIVAVRMRIFDPHGVAAIENDPPLTYCWSSDPASLRRFPPGSKYYDRVVRKPIEDALQVVQEVVIPTYRPDLKEAKIVEQEKLPKVAEADYKDLFIPQGNQAMVKALRVRFEYSVDAQPVQEDVYVILEMEQNPRTHLITWNVKNIRSMRAAAGKIAEVRLIGQTIESSIRSNLAWYNKLLQFVDERSKLEIARIDEIGARAKILAKLSNDVSNTRKKMYEDQQKAEDKRSRATAQTMREVTPYDTGDGRTVEIPNAYEHVWRGRDGQYILSSDPRYDPNADLNVSSNNSWTRLEKGK